MKLLKKRLLEWAANLDRLAGYNLIWGIVLGCFFLGDMLAGETREFSFFLIFSVTILMSLVIARKLIQRGLRLRIVGVQLALMQFSGFLTFFSLKIPLTWRVIIIVSGMAIVVSFLQLLGIRKVTTAKKIF